MGKPRGCPPGIQLALTVDLDDFLHGMHCVSICSLLENLLGKRVKLQRERNTKGMLLLNPRVVWGGRNIEAHPIPFHPCHLPLVSSAVGTRLCHPWEMPDSTAGGML